MLNFPSFGNEWASRAGISPSIRRLICNSISFLFSRHLESIHLSPMRIILSFLRIFASPFHRTDHDQDESFIVFSCMRALWILDFFLRYEILCHNRACTIDHIVEEKLKQFPHWPKYFTVRFMKWNFHVNAFGSIEVLCDIPLRLDILRRIKLRRLYLFSAGGRYLLYVILRPGSEFDLIFLIFVKFKHSFS